MSNHYVCDRCGGPAQWNLFSGVPFVQLHSAIPDNDMFVYNETFDMCRPCFELVMKFMNPKNDYGKVE
jgi:hypothetical protein